MARMTLSAIKARVLNRVHMKTQQLSLTNSASDGDSILGAIVNERASIIQGVKNFSWAQKTWSFPTTGKDQIGDLNPTFYPLPTDFKHEISIGVASLTYPLAPMAWEEYKVFEPVVRAIGTPYRYMYPPGGATICFYPSPASGYTISLSYATKPFPLWDDGAYPNVPPRVEDEYFRCLLEGCAMDVFRNFSNFVGAAQEAERRYEAALTDLVKASKMNGLIVPVLQPMDMGPSLPRAVLPPEFPASGSQF